ncbi:phosphatase [Acetobacter musti]|uniref:Phosphatase n=1 Tax=Acetobacter musti TaxID=864732 RepID=A0ABX0JSZ1_9PROT|nr:metallophosphoesterase [Acetobacter musti]NHN84684.1 phosphatase [Acetobacter musti]
MYDETDFRRRVAGRRIRVVGDVHGDLEAFRHAAATDRFIVQLGDLVDYGPDSAGALRLMASILDEDRGLFLLGNHDRKLGRALMGRKLRRDAPLEATIGQLIEPENSDVLERALPMFQEAPTWLKLGRRIFVHAAFHTGMLAEPCHLGLGSVSHLLSRALFGEVTGATQPDGYPERRLNWVDHIPAGHTVYCGHDRRSTDGRPWVRHGRSGGTAVFVDTGAGKGGHLAWIDLPEELADVPDYPAQPTSDWPTPSPALS